jgi:cobalt/nickel transport system permease protein
VGHTFLDRYHHGTSLIHHLDPRLKLLATLAFVLAASSMPPRAWPAFALLATLAVAAVIASRIPAIEVLKRSMIALPFAGMVALSIPFAHAGGSEVDQVIWAWHPFGWTITVTEEGVILFGAVMVKAWLSVLVATLLLATTPLFDLLQAMRALHVPAVLTATMSFMVRYLYILAEEAGRMQTARAARSAGPGGTLIWQTRVLGGMIGSLFIRSYERSERIYAAMLSRGFAGEIQTLTQLAWQRRDSWAGLAWIAALAMIVVAGRLGLR